MSRTVKEWIGRTDDTRPSEACQRRIVARQDRRCAISGVEFKPGDKIEFDHITPLWLGGKNAESNLQAVIGDKHKAKTKVEAAIRAKVNANTSRHLGLKRPAGKLQGPGFPQKAKREARPVLPPRSLFAKRGEMVRAGRSEEMD